jgi:DNA replication factor GINS
MNLQDLHARLAAERRSESLQSLPADFDAEVAKYLADLEAARAEEGGREFVEDELRTARQLVERLVDERLLKTAKAAVFRARGMEEGPGGLGPKEAELFGKLEALLTEGRRGLLGSTGAPEAPARKRSRKAEKPAPKAEPPKSDGVALRVLQDLAPFTGADGRVYRLRKEEVVRLPQANAEPLLKRGVVERIEAQA